MRRLALGVAAGAVLLAPAARAEPAKRHQELRAVYRELVETDTTHTTGSTGKAARAMARHLRAAGFPSRDLRLIGPRESRLNLVARLRGSGDLEPLLLLAHLDVVEARREDWSMDPFVLHERDGHFYGRGTLDDKAMAAIWVQLLCELRREHRKPRRDIIMALTADEEAGPENGVEWLLRQHRDLVQADFVLNEGGGGRMKEGRYLLNGIQASEKTYMTYRLEVRGSGGHSSLPGPDNAIYRLTAALERIRGLQFPVEVDAVTREYFARSANLATGQVADDMRAILREPPDPEAAARLSRSPSHNAMLRTTCVPTRLEAGHADNALPQLARATVNCRIMPGHSGEEVRQALLKAIWDDEVQVLAMEKDTAGPASVIPAELLDAVEEITQSLWPGVPVVPTMSSGASDSRYFRRAGIRAFGVSGLFVEAEDNRAHGKDERVGVRQFYESYEFLTRLVRKLSL